MNRQYYELVSTRPPAQRSWQRNAAARAGWVGGAAALLVLVALYTPLVWEQMALRAEPELAATAAAHDAPALRVPATLVEDQEALADLYAQVAPSVVNIQVLSRASALFVPDLDENGEGPLLEGLGSGFIYDDLGHIVTNSHVVEDAESVLVVFSNGFWADAEVVASDVQADLAVIKVTPPEGMEWRPLPMEDADTLRVGHTVIAIGNPFGLDGTMTTGVVSALGRGLPVGGEALSRYTLPDVIQTDAAINPGNSGGPLLDLYGKVVGINFAIRSQVRANAGVGFAIPASIMRRVVPALIGEGRYAYAYLGLSGSTINSRVAAALDLPPNQLGVYVAEVIPGGPSAEAGIQGGDEVVTDENGIEYTRGGDVVVAIADQPVLRFEDMVSYLVTKAAPGDSVTLTVFRDGARLEVPVVLGERPAASDRTGAREPEGVGVDAREAIEIAQEAALQAEMLTDEVLEKTATPEEQGGVAVWVVDLVTANEHVVAIVDAESGEVLALEQR
jgi:2-alkenal reductase